MTADDPVEHLTQRLAVTRAEQSHADDALALRCCELALEAVKDGCYGIGAVLVDGDGEVIAEDRNRVFTDGFHSGAHAEMLTLDALERSRPHFAGRRQARLIASLEPCAMCVGRLLLSGIGEVRHVVEDPDGGMVHRLSRLTPVWRNLASLQRHRPADVSWPVHELASRLATANQDALRARWRAAVGIDAQGNPR